MSSNAIQLSIMYSSLATALKDRDGNAYQDSISKAKAYAELAERQVIEAAAESDHAEPKKSISKEVIPLSIDEARLITLEQLDLVARSQSMFRLTRNTIVKLKEAGIFNAADLMKTSYSEITAIPGISGSTFHRINNIMRENGLSIGMMVEYNPLPASARRLLNVSLDDLHKSFAKNIAPIALRTRNCLNAADILTLRDLLVMKADDVERLPNMGKISAERLIQWLATMGLTLSVTHW